MNSCGPRSSPGWGALELARRVAANEELSILAGFDFPPESIPAEQRKWLELLYTGAFAESDPASLPGEWMIQAEWRPLLEKLSCQNWSSLLHTGVMRMEQFDLAGAVLAWEESALLRPTCWAYRNVAAAAQARPSSQQALDYYDLACSLALASGNLPIGLAVECLQALCPAGRFQEVLDVIQSLPVDCRQADRIQVLFGRISLDLGDLGAVERVLGREMLKKYPPPSSLDFRMV